MSLDDTYSPGFRGRAKASVGIRQGNAPVVLLGLVLDLSDERSSIGKEAAESGRGGEASCGV